MTSDPRSLPVSCRLPNGTPQIGDPTFADSILDRLVHNAYRIEMNGESMRRKKSSLGEAERTEAAHERAPLAA